ncbi:hypothetical protein ACIOMM_30785 [Streptomyces sp. NPDC087908]|uniref:hypothetical protein n=1 Tax=Streptomyces sp. NPDC087908 TaxID=3365820 RepID=UPI00382DDDC4
MTITDWPRTAAEPDPDSVSPAAVSGTSTPVSRTADSVSEAPDFVSETESGTGSKPSPGKLTGSQKWAGGAIVIAALVLAGIGVYLSFEHVAVFAHEELRFASLGKGQLFAVGVDVGIMVMIAVDLLMAWPSPSSGCSARSPSARPSATSSPGSVGASTASTPRRPR